MKYDVIGFPKCGSVSVTKWLNNMGHDATKSEWPYLWEINKIKEHMGERKPILVTRNKHNALWSFYEYFGYKGQISFEDFLTIRIRSTRFKNHTPLEIYDYSCIERLRELNPIVYKLEELQKLPDFPHENQTRQKSIIPDKHKQYLYSIGIEE